jgi:threonine/homoserine/homoserine lactone efflux protein
MSLWLFLSEAVLISLSGVMTPGPVTAAAVGRGSESPHAGAWIAIGHGVVEVPLMAAVFLGVTRVLDLPYVRAGIGAVGGVLLLVMGLGMLRTLRSADVASAGSNRSPLMAGILLSLGNPYLFVWWATVGATLILRSVAFGLLGFMALAVSHWLCDFSWDYFLSALSYKGGRFFGRGFQRAVFAVCGVLMLVFGARLLFDAAHGLLV